MIPLLHNPLVEKINFSHFLSRHLDIQSVPVVGAGSGWYQSPTWWVQPLWPRWLLLTEQSRWCFLQPADGRWLILGWGPPEWRSKLDALSALRNGTKQWSVKCEHFQVCLRVYLSTLFFLVSRVVMKGMWRRSPIITWHSLELYGVFSWGYSAFNKAPENMVWSHWYFYNIKCLRQNEQHIQLKFGNKLLSLRFKQ